MLNHDHDNLRFIKNFTFNNFEGFPVLQNIHTLFWWVGLQRTGQSQKFPKYMFLVYYVLKLQLGYIFVIIEKFITQQLERISFKTNTSTWGDSVMKRIIHLAYWYVNNNAVGMQICRKENSIPILDHQDLGMLPVLVLWTICQHVVSNCIRTIYYLTKDLICRQVYRRRLGRRRKR